MGKILVSSTVGSTGLSQEFSSQYLHFILRIIPNCLTYLWDRLKDFRCFVQLLLLAL